MDFFAAQDQARRATRRLVLAYILATITIVAGITLITAAALYWAGGTQSYGVSPTAFVSGHAPLLAGVALLALLFIVGSSAYKTAALSSGGGRVAQQMGGTLVPNDVSDPLRRRLRNIVEEMAIASGVPVPEIYVLEAEEGINAFAAGYAPGDAAVAVTRGTLELLDRNELQGVIAHEFSHILNGDMRLNIRLMGILYGIMVLGLIGRMIVRGGYHARIAGSRRDQGTPVVLIIGLGLVILGGLGVFAARLIKAGVSRQREFLADASAVQFTRQTTGIGNALKKIGGYPSGSSLRAADPEEVSHMLFSSGSRLRGLLATHPPLADRIRALDPNFDPADYPRLDRQRDAQFTATDDNAAGFAAGVTSAIAAGGTTVLAETIPETVGKPETEHVDYARHLRATIPEALYAAAHSPQHAYLLALALVLDRDGSSVDRQLGIVRELLGADRARLTSAYYEQLNETDAEFRLPLLEVAFPALKRRPAAELDFLIELIRKLIEVDGELDLYEYCFYRILLVNLGQATRPGRRRPRQRQRRRELRLAATHLIGILANEGHADQADATAAFTAGMQAIGVDASKLVAPADTARTVVVLDRSLDVLLGLDPRGQEALLRALSATASHDGHLAVAEAELIRTICATLQYPLPPILVHRDRLKRSPSGV